MTLGEPTNGGLVRFNPSVGAPGPNLGSPFAHLGPEADVAYNPSAPAAEVDDATARLAKIYAPAMSAVDPGLMGMLSQFAAMQRSERHAEDLVAKALRVASGEIMEDERQGKAVTTAWGSDFGKGYFKWLPKMGCQLPVLRAFARRLEVHQAILRTRMRQIDRFSRPSRAVDQMGWRVVMTEEGQEAGEDLRKDISWVTRCIECGGREFDPVERRRLKRQGATQFFRHLTRDGLELDLGATELIGLEGARGLDAWYVRPSETFALANPALSGSEPGILPGDSVYAFQILNGRTETAFSHRELALFIRNASTYAEENGYGYGEFEQTLETINNVLHAITYTKQGLNENAVPRGLLLAFGNFDHRTQQAMQAAWQAKIRGVQNQFGMPILFSRGQQGALQYLNTGQPFDEMAFAKWISFNFTIAGAIYGVSPEEVGFEGFTADGKSSLSGDDTVEKLAAAKDKGLYPLLKDMSGFVSDELVYRMNRALRLEFTGLDGLGSEERWKEKIKHMTINEVRAIFDLEPHPLGWFGDLPADTGEQSAEFQRMQQTLTFGEARKVWGGLPEYPSPMVAITPINPSLGAVTMQSLMVPPDAAAGPEDGMADPEAQDPEAQAQADAQGALTSRRLQELAGGYGPEAKGEDDMAARAGLAEAPGAHA